MRDSTRPGRRLRAIAARFCCARTMERAIDPLIADLQLEYAEAIRRGSVWRGRRIRLAAGLALLKVVVLCGSGSLLFLDDAAVDERRALIRTIAFSAVAMCAVVALLMVPPSRHRGMSLYLIPQALPLAIPVGLTAGILGAFRGRVLSVRSTRAVLLMAVAWSAISFAVLVWLLPAANLSFRESMAAARGIDARRPVVKGLNELTLTEISQRIERYRDTEMAASPVARNLRFSYHMKWSLASATAVLALFAVGVLAHRPSTRWILGLATVGACFAYYALLLLGRSAALSGAVPAFAAAWMPNVAFGLSAILLIVSSERRERGPGNLSS